METMEYHDWEGKQTEYLGKISLEYLHTFHHWPDGIATFQVNKLTYELYVELIELCLETKKPIWEVVTYSEFPEMYDIGFIHNYNFHSHKQ